MKALTVRHPWPWAICYLGKRIENRSWMPPMRQLAPGQDLAIHAGKMCSRTEIAEALAWMQFDGLLDGVPPEKIPTLDMLRTQESAIVCVCRYDGVVVRDPSRWFVGPYGWQLESTRVLLDPVPIAKGALGLWDVPKAAELKIAEQLMAAHGPEGVHG